MSKIRIRIAATAAALGMGLGTWLGAMPAGIGVTSDVSGCAGAGVHIETCTWGSPIR